MAGPSVPTIKRLFAVSGNVCAFPKCTTPLVDNASGKVTGKICHIKARQPGGKRYDPNQTEDERHGYDNLILMCPIHHDVIDSDEESYTVERLLQIKSNHESLHLEDLEPNDDIAKQFLTNITSNTITHGSLIFTQNQMGGQVAHSITNIGHQPRKISQAAANALVADLLKLSGEKIDVVALMNDAESYNLASILDNILKLAGWQSEGVSQAIFSGLPRGVILETPVEKPSLKILLNWMGITGLNPQGIIVPNSSQIKLIVGTTI